MNLTRESFSTEALSVMDQVAHLVFVAQNVIGVGPTVVKLGEFAEAEAEAKKVAAYAEGVSTGLLVALFHTNKHRQLALDDAYSKAREGFAAAYASALNLDAAEKTATGGQGKGIAGGVVAHLQSLKQAWDVQDNQA